MATTSRRNTGSTANEAPSRRARKSDPPAPSDIAAEAAAIYPDTFDTPPSPEQIAAEAYAIYCQRGYEPGRDMDDWLEAERRLSARRGQGSDPNR